MSTKNRKQKFSPWNGWGITHQGHFLYPWIRHTRRDTISAFVKDTNDPWEAWQAKEYDCRKISVIPR